MAGRFTGLLAVSVLAVSMFSAVLLLASACTSTGGSSNSASVTSTSVTPDQVLPLLLQCLVDHNIPIYDRAEGNTSVAALGKEAGWYVNGRVVDNNALQETADSLEGFYPISPDFQPVQDIGEWVNSTPSSGTWPKVCAPLP